MRSKFTIYIYRVVNHYGIVLRTKTVRKGLLVWDSLVFVLCSRRAIWERKIHHVM